MAKLVQQSTTADPLFFFLTSSSDHISGLTGKSGTVAVQISKNGAAGGAPAGAVSEIDATNLPGWYAVAGNATDTSTLGDILLHASVSGADPCDMVVAQVVAFNPRDAAALGLSRVDAAISSRLASASISLSGGAVTVGTNNDKTGYALTSGERNSVADALLDRDMSVGTDSGSTTVRTVRQALRFLRNKWAISTGTLTVYKEDDATSSWTAAVTTDGTAQPIVSNDPAGP